MNIIMYSSSKTITNERIKLTNIQNLKGENYEAD